MGRFFIVIISLLISTATIAGEATRPVQAGEIAPDFALMTVAGDSFRLSDYRGKKSVYVIFWNTWCGHCIHKVPKVIKAQKSLGTDIAIIAINTSWSDSIAEITKFQAEHNTNYDMAFDNDAKVTDSYGVWGAPTEFIIDINGVIRYRDDLPKDLSLHVASWNQLDGNSQLAGVCADQKETC